MHILSGIIYLNQEVVKWVPCDTLYSSKAKEGGSYPRQEMVSSLPS